MRQQGITRRTFLAGTGAAAVAGGPFVWTRRAGAAGKVVIRTIGGAYEESCVKAIFDPFAKATGIEVVKVPATLGKLLAMFESGNIELDVVDAGELGMLSLSQKGALDKVNYKAWKLSSPEDFDPAIRRDDMVANIYFSSVIGYNTQSFPTGKHPRSWAEFWDLKKFPGPRMLADLASGAVDLEFALLADGVPKDRLYPIDLDRGFKSLDRVRPRSASSGTPGPCRRRCWPTRKWSWGASGTAASRRSPTRELRSPSSGTRRASRRSSGGSSRAPRTPRTPSASSSSPASPRIQANFAKLIPYGPTNRQAFKTIPADVAARLPSSPEYKAKAFLHSGKWWADNRTKVSERWSQWVLQKG